MVAGSLRLALETIGSGSNLNEIALLQVSFSTRYRLESLQPNFWHVCDIPRHKSTPHTSSTMKFLATPLALVGLARNLHGVASAFNLDASHDRLDPTFGKTDTTTTFLDHTILDDWPPFYTTPDPQSLCGEMLGYNTSTDQVPNTEDCAALRDQIYDKPGLWNITAGSGREATYVLLTEYGTCAFVAASLDSSKDCL